ncbi:NADP-dependent oxidoreductase domain-containing protein [Pisolithus marmoratus]|nr:NADP-dependent oxidoreductase domain-containing protein [Pisolithus marmoratus]
MSDAQVTFDPKNMPFRRLGPSGLRVPLFSLGTHRTILITELTPEGMAVGGSVKEKVRVAFENGINMFNTAEGHAEGRSEIEMGRVIRELGYRRSDLVITTKLFFGIRSGPNNTGLSRKHIIEGTQESLKRLGLDYVDVIFAHRPEHPDSTAPVEEIVRAFNCVIDKGWAFYWATSEWSAQDIENAYHAADKLKLIAPITEQCQHKYYAIGTTMWSALAGGLLTGKYNNGIPEESRLAAHPDISRATIKDLHGEEGRTKSRKIQELTKLAETELGCSVAHLALAWVARNPNTSTVILSASKPEQVLKNLKALEIIPKLTPKILDTIEKILKNKPTPIVCLVV